MKREMILRPYQSAAVSDLFAWWSKRRKITECPIIVQPTGAGKSLVIAEIVNQLFEQWPEEHPRTIVLVPSKELAEQNAEKLAKILPDHLMIGYYSASLNEKKADADVIVATIGSIYQAAHLLGNIKAVVVDECHLISPHGAGMYRDFFNALSKFCTFRIVGLTATPFRANGVWLTDGKAPLFTGICHETTIAELLKLGFLAPLITPNKAVMTRINTDDLELSNGDYKLNELDARVEDYIAAVARETITLAQDRKKWIAFTPSVKTAKHLASELAGLGIAVATVFGETNKAEREAAIEDFKAGKYRCLVSVMALTTGFNVDDIDCLIWCRPTRSKILYVQAYGRGMRIAPGKVDCLVLDYTDTIDRLGPIDQIRGKRKSDNVDLGAPFVLCPECGNRNYPASAESCEECGHIFEREPKKLEAIASDAPVLSRFVAPKINTYEVTSVKYSVHKKEGSPDSMRVDYWSGLKIVASEWVCPLHDGYARQKAMKWLLARLGGGYGYDPDLSLIVQRLAEGDLKRIIGNCEDHAILPTQITVNESGKYPVIISMEYPQTEEIEQ